MKVIDWFARWPFVEKKSCNYYYHHSELASYITFVAYFNPFRLCEFSIWMFWLKRIRRYDCCILNLLLGCLKCKNCSFHLLWRQPNVWSFLVNQWLGRLWILKWVATNSLTLKKKKKEKLSPPKHDQFRVFFIDILLF